MRITGDNAKAYGRDVGRNEGRRNHIDEFKYVAPDGSNRLRVRFNIKGGKGHVRVFAEVIVTYTVVINLCHSPGI